MKTKTWITEEWSKGAILCSILSVLFTIGYDLIKSKPIFSTIWLVIKGVWNFIIYTLNFNLKVWWVIVGIIITIVIIYFVVNFKQEVVKPDFLGYKVDKFKRWKWTWDYRWNKLEDTWRISNLTPHCPRCDTPLIEYSMGLRFDCPRCDFNAEYDECDEPHKIERLISDNINQR
ncbi:hypothetical protein E4K67_20300 [Desulfosporosinus fructosivorans]|uniref:Uncharacterized protein n=1 Tax=Desulfosporosinus fructosivorans TaxID=2018669 RepID=A0A4Z0R2C0_9FIRM|nr:autoantigen p27 domain-containing protein [Desulfosporosinus fructosivorans]TGE36283.1 hypothetical protein E4K67_20300 [Desulfosporosinus fructosivorans]